MINDWVLLFIFRAGRLASLLKFWLSKNVHSLIIILRFLGLKVHYFLETPASDCSQVLRFCRSTYYRILEQRSSWCGAKTFYIKRSPGHGFPSFYHGLNLVAIRIVFS